MKHEELLPLGVVVERRRSDHPWQEWFWRPVAVIPGAPETADWKVLKSGSGWTRYHAATLPLKLHRADTEAYKFNLSSHAPEIYVVLRHNEEAADHEIEPFLVTASPYEAQDLLDSGDDIIEGVPMPGVILAWVQDFLDKHHVDKPFRKRKRERYDPDKVGFGQQGSVGSRGRRNG